VRILTAQPRLVRCTAAPTTISTFGGKPLVEHEGEVCFAELVVLRLFQRAGWDGRWIETFPPRRGMPLMLMAWDPRGIRHQISVPIVEPRILALLERIADMNNGSFSGCWDVLAWHDDRVIFAETKRSKNDAINSNQLKWLSSGMRAGLSVESFLLVEWSFT
jgi:hypothetical protein